MRTHRKPRSSPKKGSPNFLRLKDGGVVFEGTENVRSPDGVRSASTKVRAAVNSDTLAFGMAEIFD